MGGFFSFSRSEGYPTMYPEMKTPVTVDVLEAGFILAFVILAISFCIVLAGSRENTYKWKVFTRVVLKLLIGGILMTSNFGQYWEIDCIDTKTPYRAGTAEEINATICVKIGLRSVNITLLRIGKPEPNTPLEHEIINYNERFWWTWDQGRFGFGPYAGLLQRTFRDAQRKGLPIPILWVADYFTWDGEGLRFGRFYRTAGWYAHIAMWSAFPCWVLSNFFFLFVVRYAAYLITLSGVFQLLACILWASIRNPFPLEIPFENGTLAMSYGANFWLTIISGLVCTFLGFLIMFFDLRYPDETAVFFGIDPLSDYDEYHLTAAELEIVRRKRKHSDTGLKAVVHSPKPNTEPSSTLDTQIVFKRRTTVKYGQKPRLRTPVFDTEAEEEEDSNVEDNEINASLTRVTYLVPSSSQLESSQEKLISIEKI